MQKSTTTQAELPLTTRRYTRVSYQLFWAVRFSIDLEYEREDICTFHGVSDSTYYRIAASPDYAAYKRQIHSKKIDGYYKQVPQDAPKQARKVVHDTKTTDGTLDKAKQVLELAETLLDQAHKARNEAKSKPTKRGLFDIGWK